MTASHWQFASNTSSDWLTSYELYKLTLLGSGRGGQQIIFTRLIANSFSHMQNVAKCTVYSFFWAPTHTLSLSLSTLDNYIRGELSFSAWAWVTSEVMAVRVGPPTCRLYRPLIGHLIQSHPSDWLQLFLVNDTVHCLPLSSLCQQCQHVTSQD